MGGKEESQKEKIQIVLFTDSPYSDCDDNFHKNRDNPRGKSKKKGIVDPPAPIFKKKNKEEKEEQGR